MLEALSGSTGQQPVTSSKEHCRRCLGSGVPALSANLLLSAFCILESVKISSANFHRILFIFWVYFFLSLYYYFTRNFIILSKSFFILGFTANGLIERRWYKWDSFRDSVNSLILGLELAYPPGFLSSLPILFDSWAWPSPLVYVKWF